MATRKKAAKPAPRKKTVKKEKVKSVKKVGEISIICTDDEEVSVTVDGSGKMLVSALASLLEDRDENNTFGRLMRSAIELIVFSDMTQQD